MPLTTIGIDQEEPVTLQFTDALGDITTIPAGSPTPTWTLINPTTGLTQDFGVITVTPSTDGLSAEVVSVALGTQRIKVHSFVDGFFDVTVVAGAATGMSEVFGTPTAKP